MFWILKLLFLIKKKRFDCLKQTAKIAFSGDGSTLTVGQSRHGLTFTIGQSRRHSTLTILTWHTHVFLVVAVMFAPAVKRTLVKSCLASCAAEVVHPDRTPACTYMGQYFSSTNKRKKERIFSTPCVFMCSWNVRRKPSTERERKFRNKLQTMSGSCEKWSPYPSKPIRRLCTLRI